MIVAFAGVETSAVRISNTWLVSAGGTVTLVGTVTGVLSLTSNTWAPSDGAGPVKVTVPITAPPLVTELADNDRLCSASLPIVNLTFAEPSA